MIRASGPAMTAAQRILARCRALAALSSMAGGICRVYLSEQHRQANALVGGWMTEAGLAVRIDAAGNVCGRQGPAAAPTLMIGSHLDSVPDAGAYDGILGVLLGIETAAALADRSLPFAIEVIGFGEEEGVRFGATLMTSRACAGTWDPAWWTRGDADGVDLARAFRDFGLDPAAIGDASWIGRDVIGYLEPHIEQGPVLEALDLPLAVVSAIAGARRLELTIEGRAAHAGTAPMSLRRDALAGAARIIVEVEEAARRHDLVATVGRIVCLPNGVNVVPARVTTSIDIRASDDGHRDRVLGAILEDAGRLCRARGLGLTVADTHGAGAVRCAPVMQRAVARGIDALGLPVHHMASGAGHDAMALATLCPVGMMFVRCAGGISHHPAESVTVEDVAAACSALQHAVLALADARGPAPRPAGLKEESP